MNSILVKMYERVRMEKSKRTTRFTFVAFCVMVFNATVTFLRHMQFSALMIASTAVIIGIILIFSHRGYTKFIVPSILITLNSLIVILSFAEGLKTGVYLYILPQFFALAFLMGTEKVNIFEICCYLFVTVCCFSVCILFCKETSNWQTISPGLYKSIFKQNGITVAVLCAVFACMGVVFEKKYKLELIEEKNKAELQEMMIKGQNKHLEEIAFTTSHVIRKPLANILALTDMLNSEVITDTHIKEVITHLETSTLRLDEAVKDIVLKTKNNTSKS